MGMNQSVISIILLATVIAVIAYFMMKSRKYKSEKEKNATEYSVLRVPLIRDRIPSVAQSVPLTY